MKTTGTERAAARLYKHRVDQAIRVAPALAVLAEKRRDWAMRRANRFFKNKGTQTWPRHLLEMSREAGLRA